MFNILKLKIEIKSFIKLCNDYKISFGFFRGKNQTYYSTNKFIKNFLKNLHDLFSVMKKWNNYYGKHEYQGEFWPKKDEQNQISREFTQKIENVKNILSDFLFIFNNANCTPSSKKIVGYIYNLMENKFDDFFGELDELSKKIKSNNDSKKFKIKEERQNLSEKLKSIFEVLIDEIKNESDFIDEIKNEEEKSVVLDGVGNKLDISFFLNPKEKSKENEVKNLCSSLLSKIKKFPIDEFNKKLQIYATLKKYRCGLWVFKVGGERIAFHIILTKLKEDVFLVKIYVYHYVSCKEHDKAYHMTKDQRLKSFNRYAHIMEEVWTINKNEICDDYCAHFPDKSLLNSYLKIAV